MKKCKALCNAKLPTLELVRRVVGKRFGGWRGADGTVSKRKRNERDRMVLVDKG
jgi:hypothetical protein